MSTGAFLKRIEYVSSTNGDVNNPELITDDITISATKSTEIKNNILQITLRNTPSNYDGSNVYGTHINTNYQCKFNEEDLMTLYLKHTNDANDFLDTTWADSDVLIGDYMLKEIGFDTAEASTRLTLKAVDRAYVIFNIVWSYSYGISTTFTAPGIIRHTVRANSEALEDNLKTFVGTGNDVGVSYSVDAKFQSEGGYIEDIRRIKDSSGNYSYDAQSTLNGAISSSDTTITLTTTDFKDEGTIVITDGTNTEHIKYTGKSGNDLTGCVRGIDETVAQSWSDNSDTYQGFPEILLSKSWKPIFEWIAELSVSTQTNYSDEVQEGGTEYFSRSFMIWFDKNNAVHWLYTDDCVDTTLELGEEDLRGMRLQKSVFDTVNFIIYNCGEDMDGNGILYYWFDENSEASGLKMRYQPMTSISNDAVLLDIQKFNTSRDTSNTQDQLKQYPSSYSPAITSWSFKDDSNNFRNLLGLSARTSISNDTEYNESLREACKWRGLQQAKKITTKTSGLRYKGDIVLKGTHINPGDLIQITNRYTGQLMQKVRALNVRHQVNQNGWETILSVEEDEKTV